MIRAMIFDLDGTLLQTEWLKAISYARAVDELRGAEGSEAEVLKAFEDLVGLPRQKVASALVERFDIVEAASKRIAELGVHAPWQALVQIRLRHYSALLSNRKLLKASQWPHNVALLRAARENLCRVGLATMSGCDQTREVLAALDLGGVFDFVATVDDVEQGKPSPEIYDLVARELGAAPEECLVIEDSPTGVEAALAAGMACIAVTTSFSRKSIRSQQLLDPRWIVDDGGELYAIVQQMMDERNPAREGGTC